MFPQEHVFRSRYNSKGEPILSAARPSTASAYLPGFQGGPGGGGAEDNLGGTSPSSPRSPRKAAMASLKLPTPEVKTQKVL